MVTELESHRVGDSPKTISAYTLHFLNEELRTRKVG
jgi:hypothetical protein